MSYRSVPVKKGSRKREAIYCDRCPDGPPLVTARLALPEEKRTALLEHKALGKNISTRWSLDFPVRHLCAICMRREYGLPEIALRAPKRRARCEISDSSCPSEDGQLDLPS